MNISLTPKLKAFVAAKVKSGDYNNASEVMREALRLLQESEKLRRRRIKLLNEALDKGLDALEAGEAFGIADDDELKRFFAKL
jgi:antitoxin ParD1/3/4